MVLLTSRGMLFTQCHDVKHLEVIPRARCTAGLGPKKQLGIFGLNWPLTCTRRFLHHVLLD